MIDVSFIIPCLNCEKTIATTIRSIEELETASYQVEIIAVNNGSFDSTLSILNEFCDVKVVHCLPKGAGIARNHGAKLARGRYLAFIDSDVVLSKDWLTNILPQMEILQLGIGIGKIIPVGPKSFLNSFRVRLQKIRYSRQSLSIHSQQGVEAIINSAACIYKRSLFDALEGFNPYLSRLEDSELSLRAADLGIGILASSRAHATVFYSGGMISYLHRSYRTGRGMKDFLSARYGKIRLPHFSLSLSVAYQEFSSIQFLFYLILESLAFFGFITKRIRCIPANKLNLLALRRQRLLLEKAFSEKLGYKPSPEEKLIVHGDTLYYQGLNTAGYQNWNEIEISKIENHLEGKLHE